MLRVPGARSGGALYGAGAAVNILAFTVLNEGFPRRSPAARTPRSTSRCSWAAFSRSGASASSCDWSRDRYGLTDGRRACASRSRSCSAGTAVAFAWFLAGWRRHARASSPRRDPDARHAHPHPRHLRHLHGRHRRDRARRRPRVTGCDANVYPPMSTQLEALGIDLTDGCDAAQLDGVARDADVFVIGNVVSRGNPLMEAILDRGLPLRLGTGVAARPRARRPLGARGGRHARQDDDLVDARLDPRARGPRSRLPDRRRAGELRRVGAADRLRRSSSSRRTSTTPRSSTSARSSSTTGRAPRSSTTSSTTTPTSSPTWRRSRRSSTTSCARCRATAGSSSTATTRRSRACSRAAAGARSSASASPRCPAPDRAGRSASTARSCSAARRRARCAGRPTSRSWARTTA